MRVLVTGGTGFLGYRLIEKLIKEDAIDEIIASGRKIKTTHFVESAKVKYVIGHLSDKEFVQKLTENIDVVINCAALSSPWGSKLEFKNANIVTQDNLIKACLFHKVKQFIFISTPSVYFDFQNKLNISEEDPLPKKFINNYASSKFEAEELLRSSNIPHVIFRPRAIIGRGDHVIMPRLINAYDKNKLKIIGDGENLVDLTPVSNVVDAIILSMNNKSALNQTFNVSNGEPVKLWDKINAVLKKLDRNEIEKKIPFSVAYSVISLFELVSKTFKLKEPVTTAYSIGVLSKSFSLNIDKATQLLKYKPTQTVDEAINEFVTWYKKNEL